MTPPDPDHWTVEHVERVRVTHNATGKSAEAATQDEAVGRLISELLASGDITINGARQAQGMKPAPFPEEVTAPAGVTIHLSFTPDPITDAIWQREMEVRGGYWRRRGGTPFL